MLKKKINIIFVASEVTPIAKVGGLGDVIGALPKEINNLGLDARVIIPFYGLIDCHQYQPKLIKKNIIVNLPNKTESINLWQIILPESGLIVYLIGHKLFDEKIIYSSQLTKIGEKFSRASVDISKFIFYCQSVMAALKAIEFKPDIFHLNDWHACAIIELLKTSYANDKFYQGAKTLLTIHNLASQGIFNLAELKNLLEIKTEIPVSGDQTINMLARGILMADKITTVSPTYAREIMTKHYSAGLQLILKQRHFNIQGIINGLDINFYNPANDGLIYKKYSKNSLGEKIINKTGLQAELNLPIDQNIALVGFVSRLVYQKGINLITEEIVKSLNCQFVILGSGERIYEDYLFELQKKYPNKFKVILEFNEALAHKIFAGADIFLVPSRFEPCGLTQLISMRYGTVPVVRQTGGLADTVNKNVGFYFKHFDNRGLYGALSKALNIYYNKKDAWLKLQVNGVNKNFSWKKSALKYISLYKKLIKKP